MRISGPLLPVLLIAAAFVSLRPVDAEASIVRVYAQGHGTLLSGAGGDYFEDHDDPLIGYGAELGVKLLFLSAFMDMNILGRVGSQRLYWNQIGLGPHIGLPLPNDNLQIYFQVQALYVSGTFQNPNNEGSIRDGGFGARLGGGAQYKIVPFLWAGAALNAGGASFGPDRGGGGGFTTGKLYLRIQLGI